jgi:hypothetical protein
MRGRHRTSDLRLSEYGRSACLYPWSNGRQSTCLGDGL